ncbi:MAG: DUF4229 domain-containing protein [Acidothermus cellulolyticus]|nr:DUF4229 domain-containing protein [Acidothermus cellulolyticus]
MTEDLRRRAIRAVLWYTAARLGVFVVALGLLWLVRVRGVLLVVLALLLSGLASFALLRRQREDMGSALGELARVRRERAAARLAAEDHEMEAFAPDGGPEPDGTPGPDGMPARDEEDPDAERDGADTARRSGYHDWTASGQERP